MRAPVTYPDKCVLYRSQRDSGIDQATGPPVTYAVPFHSAHHLRWSCSKSQVLFLCSKRYYELPDFFFVEYLINTSSVTAQSQTEKKKLYKNRMQISYIIYSCVKKWIKVWTRIGYKYLTLYILVRKMSLPSCWSKNCSRFLSWRLSSIKIHNIFGELIQI